MRKLLFTLVILINLTAAAVPDISTEGLDNPTGIHLLTEATYSKNATPLLSTIQFSGYVKYMNTVAFDRFNSHWMVDNLLHNRLNFKWHIHEHLNFTAGMRNRFIYGDFVKAFPAYESLVNHDDGLLNFLSNNIYSNESSMLASSFDRLYLEFNSNSLAISLGRQRINWGQSFAWNPNDIFNAYAFLDFDYEERAGSDALRIRYFPSYASVAEVALKLDQNRHIIAAGLFRFNRWGYDMQVMGGIMGKEDYVAGTAWSGSLGNIGFNGEISYFHPQKNAADSLGILIANTGFHYLFDNSLYLVVEGIYNEYFQRIGMKGFTELYFMPLSVKTISFSKFSWLAQASYPLHPLLNISLAAMYLPSLDNGSVIMPALEYSASNNFEVSLRGQRFAGAFNDKREKLTMLFLRFRYSF